MDKTSKIFIGVMAILFVIVTAVVFFGGNSYELQNIGKNSTPTQTQNDGSPKVDNGSFQPYMDIMHEKITKKWTPPQTDKDAEVTVEYTIMKNGAVKDPKIVKSSGNNAIDKSAIDALNNASPLPPLPLSYDKDSINVKFNFTVKASE